MDCAFPATTPLMLARHDPISSGPSQMIEVFPGLRRLCAAHDLSSVRLIDLDLIAKADFIFG